MKKLIMFCLLAVLVVVPTSASALTMELQQVQNVACSGFFVCDDEIPNLLVRDKVDTFDEVVGGQSLDSWLECHIETELFDDDDVVSLTKKWLVRGPVPGNFIGIETHEALLALYERNFREWWLPLTK